MIMRKFIKGLSAIVVLLVVSCSGFALGAERYNLVLFYAPWNVYSEQAIDVLQQVAENSPKISFEKINIDDKKAFVRMKQLGVMPTDTIPYYFLMDKNKKVVYGAVYKKESVKVITDLLEKRIND